MLRQSTDEDLHGVGVADAADPFRGDDVDHPGSQTAVGDDRDAFLPGGSVEGLLVLHDLGVATQIGAMQPGRHRRLRDGVVEEVRRRIHDGVVPAHQGAQPCRLLHVHARQGEPLPGPFLEKRRYAGRTQVSEGDALHLRQPQQIERASRPLQTSAQHQHPHRDNALGLRGAKAS